MVNKLTIVGIAILAVGMVALPQTLALFAGQHNFYDTPVAGNQVPCEKCHADIRSELTQPGSVNTLHLAQDCEGCHMTTAPAKEGLVNGPGGQFHAAAAPACLDCHATTGPGLNALNILNGPEEVHKPFANQANTSLLLKGSNEACISCHTHVAVDINWTKAYKIRFNAVETTDPINQTHSWNVNNFAAEGSAFVQTYGNQSGQITNATAPKISISPAPGGFDPNNP